MFHIIILLSYVFDLSLCTEMKYHHKGRDTLTPLPFVVMWDMFWQRRSASYFVNMRSVVNSDRQNVSDLMYMKYEADLLCQNITYITTKGRGVRVSHPVIRWPCGRCSPIRDIHDDRTHYFYT